MSAYCGVSGGGSRQPGRHMETAASGATIRAHEPVEPRASGIRVAEQ
jgi:hypothetical protein